MLNRPDWEKVLSKYPKAFEACRSYFKESYDSSWRDAIRDPEKLHAFFGNRNLMIRFFNVEGDWRFHMRLPWGRLEKGGWRSKDDCERAALLTAFKELDLILAFEPGH